MDEQQKNREDILAAIKAKADAIRAQRAAAATKGEPAEQAAGAAAAMEMPVSAVNAAGRPAATPANPKVTALGTVTMGVTIRVEKSEDENVRKLLGGLGAYASPLTGGDWQLDYRYYEEARRRLEHAGYEIEASIYTGAPLSEWTPHRGGWSIIED